MPQNITQEKRRLQAKRKTAVHQFSELMEELTYDPHSRAILFALEDSAVVEGLRYNELYRTANRIFSESHEMKLDARTPESLTPKPQMSIKTFDEHLKRIVSTKLVERIEVSRHEVRYRIKYLNKLTKLLAMETAEGIKLFQQATQETWSFLKKTQLSDAESVKLYVGFFCTFLNILSMKTLYLGVKLWQAKDPIHVVFLTESTFRQITNHVALAAALLATIPDADKEVNRLLIEITTTYESLLKKIKNQVE